MIITPCSSCLDPQHICVPGRGNTHAELLMCGEAPGKDEVKHVPPMCWIGKTGQELENYVTKISNIDIDTVYLTNLVKCHPPNDRDPTKEEIEACSKTLMEEINNVNPKYIACLGAISTRFFLGGDVTLERVHGIPVEKEGRIILPMYHPAAGLHNSTMMVQIVSDFEVLGRLVRGTAYIGGINDRYKDCDYRLPASPKKLEEYIIQSKTVAIDTESVKKWEISGQTGEDVWFGETEPWCLSISVYPGTGKVVMMRDEECMNIVRGYLVRPDVLTLVHNVMYDKPILDRVGVRMANFRDTMVMAYLTQSLPQGLKDLAYRLCGMEMRSYDEMVKEVSIRNALMYLDKINKVEWGKPEEKLVWDKKGPHVKRGWGLNRRITRILNDFDKDEETDVKKRWENVDEELRIVAEGEFGRMPIGDLSEIDVDEAVKYSGRDADATLRVYPRLLEHVEGLNIRRVE